MLTSIDHDVERLYIIDNGGVVSADEVKHFRANDVHVADPGYNMGVAQSWNQIIRANIFAPWWLIGSNDVILSSGSLSRLVTDMEAHTGRPHLSRIVIGNESWGNHFGIFALNPEAIDMVGWFDENFHPIYFEDTEYIERIERAKEDGFTVTDIASNTHHDGNASWKTNAHLKVGNQRSWDYNGEYIARKWPSPEVRTPFGLDVVDGLRYTPALSVSRLRGQDWNVDRKDNVKNDGHFV